MNVLESTVAMAMKTIRFALPVIHLLLNVGFMSGSCDGRTRDRSQLSKLCLNSAEMTKPKTKPCPSCQAPNACNRKTCSACLGSLDVKVKLRKKQEKVKNSDWAASIRKNRNSSRVVHSAQLSVFKLHALGYQPVLFLCQCDRKGRIIGDLITHIQPAGGAAHEILMEMRKLYEDLLSELQAPPHNEAAPDWTPAAGPSSDNSVGTGPDPDPDPELDPDPDPDPHPHPHPHPDPHPHPHPDPDPDPDPDLDPDPDPDSDPDPDPAPDQEAPNEEFILHSESVPTSSSLLPPTSSSLCPLPPGPSYPSPLPPTSFYPSPLPAPPSVSAVYTSDVPTRKRKRKECRKHHTQQIFLYEAMVDRSVVDGKEEVKVKWKPCSTWSSGPGGDWRRL